MRNALHVVMASNEKWIVPAGEDERRYVVFDVAEDHKQDPRWFKPLHEEMRTGGDAAMLHDLLAMDLGAWHPRQIIRTRALREQQSRALSPQDAWWVQLLETGSLAGADPREPHRAISNGHDERIDTIGGGQRLRKRYGKVRGDIFTFLIHPDAPPDNNSSERELRPTATYRNVTGGFRSQWGDDLFASVRSVVGTAARSGIDAYAAVLNTLCGCKTLVPG